MMNQQCPICLDQPCDLVTVCAHKFCKKCLEPALKKLNFCPMCRKADPLSNNPNQTTNKPSQDQWNLLQARKVVFTYDPDGKRRVNLVDDKENIQKTNIFIAKGTQITCGTLIINGKKVDPNTFF